MLLTRLAFEEAHPAPDPLSPRRQVPAPHCCPPATARPCSCDEPLRGHALVAPQKAEALAAPSDRTIGPVRRMRRACQAPSSGAKCGMARPSCGRLGGPCGRSMSPAPPFLRLGWAGAASARLPRAFRAPCAEKPYPKVGFWPRSRPLVPAAARAVWAARELRPAASREQVAVAAERHAAASGCAKWGSRGPAARTHPRRNHHWVRPSKGGELQIWARKPVFGECFARKRVFGQRA